MIIKVKNKPGFAQIQNETLRDKRLSLESRGALAEVLTYCEDFETSVDSLMALWEIGRDKLLKITNQLKEFGYLEIVPVRDAKGKIVDKEWHFYGESQNLNFRLQPKPGAVQDTENTDDGCVQDTDFTYVGENQSLENTDDLLKEESSQKKEFKDLKKSSSSSGGEKTKTAATAAVSQIVLSDEEKQMSNDDYLEYLQTAYPQRDVLRVFQKLKDFCARDNVTIKPTRLRLKKWLETEDDEFAPEVQTNIPPWQKAINDCALCDEKGLIEMSGKLKPCKHEKPKI